MKLLKTTALGAILGGLAMVSFSASAAYISFDDDGVTQTGSLFYAGIDNGQLIGTDIDFVSITGEGTPIESTIGCQDCVLNFNTGFNTAENIGGVYTWSGTGSELIISGLVPSITGLDSGGPYDLVTGTFDSVSVNINTGKLTMSGFGTDTKDERLLAYFGVTQGFEFATTAISIENLITDPAAACTAFGAGSRACEPGAFFADVSNADFDNLSSPIPVPAAVWLFGSGLLGLVGIARRRRA